VVVRLSLLVLAATAGASLLSDVLKPVLAEVLKPILAEVLKPILA
jgi:hypothetical protein